MYTHTSVGAYIIYYIDFHLNFLNTREVGVEYTSGEITFHDLCGIRDECQFKKGNFRMTVVTSYQVTN